MDNKNIPTRLGAAILVVIAITAGVFVWVYEKGQNSDTADITTQAISKPIVKTDTQKNDEINITDVLKWESFDSKSHGSKYFNFSFQYPSTWFNPTDIGGDTIWGFPFYLKSQECIHTNTNKVTCTENTKNDNMIALVETILPPSTPKKVSYSNEQSHLVVINNYKGTVIEGVVNNPDGGYIARDGEREVGIIFPDIKKEYFLLFMKLEKDLDRDIFDQIVKTLSFE